MNDLEKKIINLAGKHFDFDESLAMEELNYLNSVDLDLVKNLWTMHIYFQERGEIRSENKLDSCLAYYLNITTCKPTQKFHIEKRRTYGREGFPDIDMDFDYLRRSEIIDYCIEKYGRDYVGNIGTIQTLKIKAAVRRAIKVLDPTNSIKFDRDNKVIKIEANENFALENEILATLPTFMKSADGSDVKNITEACEEFSEFKQYMDKYPEVFRIAKELEGTIAGFGSHAAGFLLSPIPLAQIAPMRVTRQKNSTTDDGKPERVVATQFPMADVERMGLIKFDILGLSTKTAISWACVSLKEKGIDIEWNKIPLDDEKTLELLRSGYTDGCFQLEKHGMKECLKMISIDSFDDLVVAIAMYRPGPKEYIPEFAGRKKGSIAVTYPHELLRKITEPTYGIICYQEQVMKVFMVLAGLTASDGYAFMKGCAKKKTDIIDGYKSKFFKGAEKQNIDIKVIQDIWDDLFKFSGYAFNLAHSVSYAYESYKTAYLKAHHPTEFIAARLSVETRRRNFDDVMKYKKDAEKHFGFSFKPVDINKSKLDWSIEEEKVLRIPLLIKGVGIKAAEDIIENQPYTGRDILLVFGRKVGKAVNSKVMEAMKDAGFWKGISKEKLLSDFDKIKKDKKRTRGRTNMDLFA